ncbi:MAG: 30S ribosomal protein S6 [Phycisphaerae bacterium]|nr:30S ribosomal protein S6 [Phycisphaerae bacterium]
MAETQTYEGMFLMESGQDFEQATEPIRSVLERHEAEVRACKPWDDRKLAYTIDGHKRGLYVLTYFSVDPSRVVEIERDAQLNGQILRLLVLRKDQLSEDEINATTPAESSARKSGASGASSDKKAEGKASDTSGGDKAPEVKKASDAAAGAADAPKGADEASDAPSGDAPSGQSDTQTRAEADDEQRDKPEAGDADAT